MTINAISRRSVAGLALVTALALPAWGQAQTYSPAPMSDAEIDALPVEYQAGPVTEDYVETTIGADGVETVTRTRRIESRGPYTSSPATPVATYGSPSYAPAGYAPAASVFEREQWLEECESRTNGRDDGEKGGIIGGLLGAIAGGIIGNRVDDGNRLAGTLIGVGAGGLAGGLLGSLIGGGRDDRGEYDCEAALDSYLSQYGYPSSAPVGRYASRSIPAPYTTYPAYAPPAQYGYGYAYAPTYTYQPPQQVVYVPVEYQQRQRVIVRETTRMETVPGAARTIPAPQPVVEPAPAPAPRYIKGN